MDYNRTRHAVISRRSPVDDTRYGLLRRTIMFGAVAAVLRYNVFSRILSELAPHHLGAPLRCFFGDFGSIDPGELAGNSLLPFAEFRSKSGVKLKSEKSSRGRKIAFLESDGSSACRSNVYLPLSNLADDSAERWGDGISSHIRNRPKNWGILSGSFAFRRQPYGDFARTHLIPLYK